MNQYAVSIHYATPSHCGGIQSRVQTLPISAHDEEKAEQAAVIIGVNDPNYLYTQMVEVNRVFAF